MALAAKYPTLQALSSSFQRRETRSLLSEQAALGSPVQVLVRLFWPRSPANRWSVKITTINLYADYMLVMLAVNRLPDVLIDSSESGLLPIHHSKISLQHAKAGYDYPTSNCPIHFLL